MRERRKEIDLLSSGNIRASFSRRTIASICAPLERYLGAGNCVLDVGCGVGSVTCDVASIVNPGRVRGVDVGEPNISQARECAKERAVENVHFDVADALALPLDSDSFDVTYSNGLFEWLRDPLSALKEQIRVTRSGGLIVAFSGSYSDQMILPEPPSHRTLLEEMKRLADPGTPGVFFNTTFTHGMRSLWLQAGLTDVKLEAYIPPENFAYYGSEFFESWYRRLLPRSSTDSPVLRSLIDLGVELPDLEELQREVEAWHDDPNALVIHSRMCAVARVP